MRQTTNYQLPSWDSGDRILRSDFNALTEKTDAAIAGNAAAIANNAAASTAAVAAEAAARTAAVSAEAEARAAAVTAEAQARAAGDLLVRLVDYTAPAATTQINIDVSGIDFTQYSRIDFYLEHTITSETARPQLLVNGLTSGYDSYSFGNKYASSCLVTYSAPSNSHGAYGVLNGIMVFNPPVQGSAVQCLSAFGGSPTIAYAPVKWEALNQWNLVCSSGTFPAGTRVILTGVRK